MAGAFITIFCNLLDLDNAERAIERFLFFDGQWFVMETLQRLFLRYEEIMVDMDAWELQVFIGRKIYKYALDQERFFFSQLER